MKSLLASCLFSLLSLLIAHAASAQMPETIWMRGGQAGGSNLASWAPDGQSFAIAGQDGTIKLFDGGTNWLVSTIEAYESDAEFAHFSPDGSRLVSIGDNNILRAWDVATEAMLWEANLVSWFMNAAFSPDGSLVANGRGSVVEIRDADTGAVLETLPHVGNVGDVAFSPDGLRLVAGGGESKETIRSWRTSDWALEHTYATTHKWADFAFTPDGSMMASGGGFDNPSIRLWDPATGALLRTISVGGSFGPAYQVGITADAQYVYASHRYNLVKIFRVDTGELVNHIEETVSIQVAPDEQTFLGQPPTCGEPFQRWATFSFPDGQLLEEFMTHSSTVYAMDVSPGGSTVASGAYYFDSAVRLWDVETSQRTGELYYTCNSDGVTDVAYSPDGALLAAGGGDFDPTVRVWRLSDGALLYGFPHDPGSTTQGLAFSPDGLRLVSGSSAGTVLAVAALSGAGLWSTTTGDVDDLAYSPDGTLIAVGTRFEGVRFLDAGSGAIVRTIAGAHSGSVTRVDFSADGSQLVTGGSDGLVKVWTVDDGTLVRTLSGGSGAVNALDLSGDDRFLLSADPTHLYLWDFAAGTVLASYDDETTLITDARFLSDGAAFAYSRLDATVVLARNPAASSAVTVSAEPVGGPITIPASGGAFEFTVTLTNTTAEPQSVEAWSAVSGPVDREPVLGPRAVALAPGQSLTRTLTQAVPAASPAGTYAYAVNVGLFGSTAASDGFAFVKEGDAARGSAEGAWSVSGWDEALQASARLPGGFTLSEAHPNPFRSSARLALEVAEAQHVRAVVFDGLGRRVAVLHEGVLVPGAHVLELRGGALPPGVYVVRVAGETFAASRRLTLVR